MISNVLTLKSLVKIAVSNMFWKVSWKSSGIQMIDAKHNIEHKWVSQLISCREEALKYVNIFMKKENYPLSLILEIKKDIHSLLEVYRQLFLWKHIYDPNNEINLLEEGDLYAPNFSDSTGIFNDYMWVKRFINNTKYSILIRFTFACLFCKEDKWGNFWLEIKRNFLTRNNAFCTENYYHFMQTIWQPHSKLIECVISQLENLNDPRYLDNCYKMGFQIAAEGGYEYGVYYYWNKMSNREKFNVMQNDYFFKLMNLGIDFPFQYISYFLFSKLSEVRIENLTRWTRNSGRFEAWYNRIFMMGSESPYSIIKYVPIQSYFQLLTSLLPRIWLFHMNFDIIMFITLLIGLDSFHIELILESCPFTLEMFAKRFSIHVLHGIFFGLSLRQKEKILLYDFYGGGITVINVLFEEKKFDEVHKYLCLFLMDTKSLNVKILRMDAIMLLEMFSHSPGFLFWCDKRTSKENANQMKVLINTLQETVALIDDLCETVNNKNIDNTLLSTLPFSDNDCPASNVMDLTIYSSLYLKRKTDENLKSFKIHKKS